MRGVQRGWCGRKLKRVRDLSCGNTHVYLEYRVRARALLTVRQGEAGARRALTLAGGQTLYTKRLWCMRTSVAASGYSECGQDQILTGMRSRNRNKEYMRGLLAKARTLQNYCCFDPELELLAGDYFFQQRQRKQSCCDEGAYCGYGCDESHFFLLNKLQLQVQIQRTS